MKVCWWLSMLFSKQSSTWWYHELAVIMGRDKSEKCWEVFLLQGTQFCFFSSACKTKKHQLNSDLVLFLRKNIKDKTMFYQTVLNCTIPMVGWWQANLRARRTWRWRPDTSTIGLSPPIHLHEVGIQELGQTCMHPEQTTKSASKNLDTMSITWYCLSLCM